MILRKRRNYFRSFYCIIELCEGGDRLLIETVKKGSKFLPIFSLFLTLFSGILFQTTSHAQDRPLLYVIPIEKEVERGLEAFLRRTTDEAITSGADYILFEINTPGGWTDAAGNIATILQNLDLPTISFVKNEALSAGSYIALNTDMIYMAPHATMGSSAVIQQDGTAADAKAQSAWIAKMKEAAESKGRDPIYAQAMADQDVDLPELNAPEGKLLTLGATDALKIGYAEGIVRNLDELLEELQIEDATIVEVKPTFAEEIARFVTSPLVIPILLSIASLAFIVELYSPGFGVAGTMGLISLALFFYGHMIAGLAGFEAIILFLVGIALIVLEFFVTSGILGILGAVSILGSLFLAGYDFNHMIISIAIAMAVAVVGAITLYYLVGTKKRMFKHLILYDRTTTDLGYVSNVNREELIGLIGQTITPLRPSGSIMIEDEKFDVVSEGGFIEANQKVKVIKVEGMRIVVREI